MRGSVPVDAYVRRTLVNNYLTHLRRHRREKVTADVPDLAAPVADTHDDLGQALRSLPAHQRAVVVLQHLEDLSISDVADLLRIAEGTVKSQSARGIAALRAALNQNAHRRPRETRP